MARGLLVWFLIMLLETAHGVLRGLLLVPRVGEAMAGRIGWPVAAALVLGVTTLAIRWMGIRQPSRLLALGAVWAILTLAFEFGFGLLRGLSAPQVLAAINPLLGGMLVWSLLVMLLAPLVATAIRGRLDSQH